MDADNYRTAKEQLESEVLMTGELDEGQDLLNGQTNRL